MKYVLLLSVFLMGSFAFANNYYRALEPGQKCVDTLAATIDCGAGFELVSVGCENPEREGFCAPECSDSRRVYLYCAPGSELTNVGCNNPKYEVYCAPTCNIDLTVSLVQCPEGQKLYTAGCEQHHGYCAP